MARKSFAQHERQETREVTSGRYSRGLVCEACRKSAPFNYYSHPDCNRTGELLVLCGRARCAGTAAERLERIEDAVAYVKAKRDGVEVTSFGVCICNGARHEPNHEWTAGHPHTSAAAMSEVIIVGDRDGVPVGLCDGCEAGRCS